MIWLLPVALLVWWLWREQRLDDDAMTILMVDGLGDNDPEMIRAADRARRRERRRLARRLWLRHLGEAMRDKMRTLKLGLVLVALVVAVGSCWTPTNPEGPWPDGSPPPKAQDGGPTRASN